MAQLNQLKGRLTLLLVAIAFSLNSSYAQNYSKFINAIGVRVNSNQGYFAMSTLIRPASNTKFKKYKRKAVYGSPVTFHKFNGTYTTVDVALFDIEKNQPYPIRDKIVRVSFKSGDRWNLDRRDHIVDFDFPPKNDKKYFSVYSAMGLEYLLDENGKIKLQQPEWIQRVTNDQHSKVVLFKQESLKRPEDTVGIRLDTINETQLQSMVKSRSSGAIGTFVLVDSSNTGLRIDFYPLDNPDKLSTLAYPEDFTYEMELSKIKHLLPGAPLVILKNGEYRQVGIFSGFMEKGFLRNSPLKYKFILFDEMTLRAMNAFTELR